MRLNIILSLITCAGLIACTNNSTSSSVSGNLSLTLMGLERMTGQHYEGWVISDGQVISSGRFNLDANGNIIAVDSNGSEQRFISSSSTGVFSYKENSATPSAFVLTIEPDNDIDEGPSAVHLVAGNFENDTVIANTAHPSAIGSSFDSTSGTYILATPTTALDSTDENQGVWFLNSGAPSLVLPGLSADWAYEGWVVDKSTGAPISTGVFTMASGFDSNGAGPSAGSDPGPPFPGDDFISPDARVLNDGDHDIVITVEPVPDFDPSPFAIKILASSVTNGQSAGVSNNHNFTNINNGNDITVEATLLP